jgi:choline dehydrogenase-like flavoprotein
MTDRVVVVGSGASGVHFAFTLLQKGRRVLMLDVGRRRPAPVLPDQPLNVLKGELGDPASYFLGEKFSSLILPGHHSEYYGFPPGKDYVFDSHPRLRYRADGFAPLISFAAGGLAEAWTGGCYPFNEEELAAFPFRYADLEPCYSEVARRIGVNGADDDLARFMPRHGGLLEPLSLDEHSARLLEAYAARRGKLNAKLGAYVGRARVATLSSDLAGRRACWYCGRCLWGCPSDSLYTPAVTLEECRRDSNFEYAGGLFVTHFRFDSANRVTSVVARSAESGDEHQFEVGALALAAGTLCSSKIFLDSIYLDTGAAPELPGLMDNRQVLMPFVNLKLVGRPFEPRTYQYHQLAIGVTGRDAMEYVHGLITTLKTAQIHPVVQSLPFDLATSLELFRNLRAALGLVNINFSDFRREGNSLGIEPDGEGGTRLLIRYEPEPGERARLSRAIRTFRRLLRNLGCVAPRLMTHVRPMGASVHYAGTIPMTRDGGTLTADEVGRSRDFENLFFVDGTTFPALPAKNLTFTLMANATRIAHCAF